jgi:ATP-dependent Lhr-like helicase
VEPSKVRPALPRRTPPSGAPCQRTTTVIIDEIHALVPTKRGAHLALSLERLEALTRRPLQRIGLSATQGPLDAGRLDQRGPA